MKFLTAKTRITIGLTGLIVTLMVTVSSIGVGPNERKLKMDKRLSLAESTAIGCSIHLNQRQFNEVEFLLRALAERNPEVISAAIRRNSGRLDASIGNHEDQWQVANGDSETHLAIPLQVGKSKWGSIEILFRELQAEGLVGWLSSEWVRYFFMTGALNFFVVYFFLGLVLKQLDPSKAVPRRVRDALNTLAEGLILTDRKGRVLLANEVFAEWSGKAPDRLFGVEAKKFKWRFDQSDQDTDSALGCRLRELPWNEALRSQTPQAGRLLTLEKSDGQLIRLIANASPILGPDGSYRGVLTSFEDVTELEEHKVQLSRAKVAADDANRAKSAFLARMSHEIRTPMNAILGYTEVLRFGIEDDVQKREQHLTTIQHSGEHLLELINDILDLSKIESGNMELELQRVSVHELISQVVSVLEIKASEKGIGLNYRAGTRLPETVATDGVRLKQAIINLVSNAIKFTEQGGVLIQPELVEQDGGTRLLIHVVDSGIGMTSEGMAKIFDPFAQADVSITRRFGGTGLGLTICREICEKMGGGIDVASKLGQGSVFTICIDPGDLSGVRLLTTEEFETKPGQPLKSAEELQLPAASVLIVDDSEPNRELVALFLKRGGIEFAMAENGKIAIEMVMRGGFDIVLMDMHMPVMDGFEATRVLRSHGKTIPIIALTADAMAQDERKCRDAGCSGFLPKPISRDRLYAVIRDALSVNPETACRPIPSGKDLVSNSSELAATQNEPTTDSVRRSASETWVVSGDCPPTESEVIRCSLPMDDEDFVMIANMFVTHLQSKIQLMDAAAQARDFGALAELGHWLKGAGGSAGFDVFTVPGKSLETHAKGNELDKSMDQIEQIREMTQRIQITPECLTMT